MKVKELIEQLKKLPDDMEVIIAKDEEGNYFSPLSATGDNNTELNLKRLIIQ